MVELVSVAEILDAICDDKSLKLFNAIATKGETVEISRFNLSYHEKNIIQECHD